jgi:Acetyl-CoA dehydrogenase C-terminal like
MTGYLLSSQENARELYRLGLESVRFLLAVGDLLIGWLLLHQAEIALNALEASAGNSASLSVTPVKAAGDAARISLSALSSYALSSDLARSADGATVTLLVGEREGSSWPTELMFSCLAGSRRRPFDENVLMWDSQEGHRR